MRSASGVPAAGISLRKETATGETPSRCARANITSISAILVIILCKDNRLPPTYLRVISQPFLFKQLLRCVYPQWPMFHIPGKKKYTHGIMKAFKDAKTVSWWAWVSDWHMSSYQCKFSMKYFRKTGRWPSRLRNWTSSCLPMPKSVNCPWCDVSITHRRERIGGSPHAKTDDFCRLLKDPSAAPSYSHVAHI